MSYRHYNYGVHLPVACVSSKICIWFHTGMVECNTTLADSFDKQVIPFNLPGVLFVAEGNGIRYIGRKDGSISGYRIVDDVLVRIATWSPPRKPELKEVGMINNIGLQNVYLDMTNKRTMYVKDCKAEFQTFKEYDVEPMLHQAIAKALAGRGYNLSIVDVYGKEVDPNEIGRWSLQTSSEQLSVRGIF